MNAIAAALAFAAATIAPPAGDWHVYAPKWLPMDGEPTLPRATLRWFYNPAGEPGPWALDAIRAAAAEWSAVCGVRLIFGGRTAGKYNIDGHSTIAWGRAGDGYAGFTMTDIDGAQIIESDIVLDPLAVPTPAAVQALARHELGHAIGIAHSDVEGAAMSGPPYSSYSWPYRIASDDVTACRALYGIAKQPAQVTQ